MTDFTLMQLASVIKKYKYYKLCKLFDYQLLITDND